MSLCDDQFASARKILGWAARIDTAEHLEVYLHSNPTLFIPRISEQLREEVRRLLRSEGRFARRLQLMDQGNLPEDDPELSWQLLTESLEEILDRIDELRFKHERHEDQFPLGRGPIEELWSSIDAGALRVDEAEALARSGRAARCMAPTYVYALSNHTVNLTHSGQYGRALTHHRVLLSAMDATQGLPEHSENMNVVGSDWTEIVLNYLADIPDARLFRDALDRGKKVVERTSVSDPELWHSLTVHRLGILHLEPYVRGRTPENFPMQEKIWRAKFLSLAGADAGNTPESIWQMPAIEEALAAAESYLRQARAIRKEEERALSIKALVETLSWKYSLGTSGGKAEITTEVESLANEALALGLSKYPEHVFYLTLTIRLVTGHLPANNTILTLQYVRNLQPTISKVRYCELLIQLGNVVQFSNVQRDIEEYVEALRDSQQLFAEHAHPVHKIARRKTLCQFLWQLLAPSAPRFITGLVQSLRQLEQASSHRERAGHILRMASQAESLEEELAAHALMKSLTEYVPEILEQYPDAIAQLKGELSLNLGADFTNSQKYEEAASAYAEALSNYVFIDEPDMCREALRRFMEVFAMSNHNVTDVALQLLLQSGIRYELLAGTQGALELKELSDLCSARIYEVANTSVNKLAILIQLAKCRLFASTCAGQPRIDVSSTPSLNSLLQQIAEVETELQHLKSSGRELKEIEAPEPESPGTVDDDLYQLSSPIPGEAQMGADLQAIRGNLQYRFDTALRGLLWQRGGSDHSVLMRIDEICASLDPETAVLDMYLGADPKGALAVYVFTYTNNSFLTSRVVHPSYTTYFLSGTRRGQKVLFSAMAGFVRDARRGILAEPGFGPVTPEAQIEFKKWVEGFFSHALLEVLHESGRSHLCIIPNGPLHFFPFHLLGPIEMPFAQRWNITYNPHVSLVKRKQQAHNPTDMMLAGGKSFTTNNPRGLPEITEAVREAEEIAEMFASHALVEDAFTPSSLLSRIDSCRYVHVSTHGEQNVLAPSFHTLFMSPDDGGSDTVSAYQIHKLDLSDVDLLTLSACETGLGRVDAGDNLGGLPASFLIAGVRTVVATLWQVISSASRVFFLRLYAELKIGRSKLEAFATAQAATRDAFPAYRDWGAFYMIGNWT